MGLWIAKDKNGKISVYDGLCKPKRCSDHFEGVNGCKWKFNYDMEAPDLTWENSPKELLKQSQSFYEDTAQGYNEHQKQALKEARRLLAIVREDCINCLANTLELDRYRNGISFGRKFCDCIFVTYYHAENSTYTKSAVKKVYLKEDKIMLGIEDCSEYSIDNVSTEELSNICNFIECNN